MSGTISFNPVIGKWVLSDGEHHLTIPYWARDIIADESERKNKPLREQLDQLKAENAKLREEVEQWHRLTAGIELPDYPITEFKPKDLERENAKLRKLCAGLLTGYECGRGELCKGCTWDGLGDPKTFPCLPRVKARELGVEVS